MPVAVAQLWIVRRRWTIRLKQKDPEGTNMKSNHYLHWLTVALIAVASGSFSARGDVIYESATLGPTGQTAGATLSDLQFLGSRFSLNDPVQVQAIGGHMFAIGVQGQEAGPYFGAIVSLSGPSALPSGNPFDMTTQAMVTFTLLGYEDADVIVPLSVQLQPGNYGIIFGSEGNPGGMPGNDINLPGTSYFGWFNNTWNDDSISNTRFVVYGVVVPEPNTCMLLMTGLLGLAMALRRAGVSA
jgi:hypothetical protein